MNRKNFLQQATLGTAGLFSLPFIISAQTTNSNEIKKPDPIPSDRVKDFVIAGHGNLDKVRAMLAESPTLLYATWDWGGGDFETAIEGAGHVGNKEVANYLIGQGARTNMFVLTMLGKTNIVKSYLETFPQYLNARGPHGFTFLHHAIKGGDDAKELKEYFESRGLKETKANL